MPARATKRTKRAAVDAAQAVAEKAVVDVADVADVASVAEEEEAVHDDQTPAEQADADFALKHKTKQPPKAPANLSIIFVISTDAAEHEETIKQVKKLNKKGGLLQDVVVWDRAKSLARDFTGAFEGHRSYLLDVPLKSLDDWEDLIHGEEPETDEDADRIDEACKVFRSCYKMIWMMDPARAGPNGAGYTGARVWSQRGKDQSIEDFCKAAR